MLDCDSGAMRFGTVLNTIQYNTIQYNTNKFVTRPTCQFASESGALLNKFLFNNRYVTSASVASLLLPSLSWTWTSPLYLHGSHAAPATWVCILKTGVMLGKRRTDDDNELRQRGVEQLANEACSASVVQIKNTAAVVMVVTWSWYVWSLCRSLLCHDFFGDLICFVGSYYSTFDTDHNNSEIWSNSLLTRRRYERRRSLH